MAEDYNYTLLTDAVQICKLNVIGVLQDGWHSAIMSARKLRPAA
jgi:hypothetical protein